MHNKLKHNAEIIEKWYMCNVCHFYFILFPWIVSDPKIYLLFFICLKMVVPQLENVLFKFLTDIFTVEKTVFTNVPVLHNKEQIFSLSIIPIWENKENKILKSISIEIKNAFENDLEIENIYMTALLVDSILESVIETKANQNTDFFYCSTLKIDAKLSETIYLRREIE